MKNGRPQRPNAAERREAQKLRECAEQLTVLAQPHRRGNPDQMCGDSLGRFVLAHRLGREVYDLGQRYGMLVRRFYASRGHSIVSSGSRGSGLRNFRACDQSNCRQPLRRSTARWSRSRARDCPPCELFAFSRARSRRLSRPMLRAVSFLPFKIFNVSSTPVKLDKMWTAWESMYRYNQL